MYTVLYFPPGRDDEMLFSCKAKPLLHLSQEAELHTLLVTFVPTNGPQQGQSVTVPAAHALVGEPS